MTTSNPRPLDHLVLPVAALDTARDRLTRLGFTVAPNGVHPFGTANCCVFFTDGTFLEPLAVADPGVAQTASAEGNVFVRHDADFRSRQGDEGLSALVLGTSSAQVDHQRFCRLGVSAGDILNFGRDFVAADGRRDRAEFRLAFAKSSAAPDCLFFTCERIAVPAVDRSALQRHANGVAGIRQVVMVASDPSAHTGFLEEVTGVKSVQVDGGEILHSGTFELLVTEPATFANRTALPRETASGSRFQAVVFDCTDLASAEATLHAAGAAFHHAPAGLVVPPGPGQGAAFIFASQEPA